MTRSLVARSIAVAALVAATMAPVAPAQSAAARITLHAPPSALVNANFTLGGRIKGMGSSRATVKLMQFYSGSWHLNGKLSREKGRYRFIRRGTQPGNYIFRTVVVRSGSQIATSPRRTVEVTTPTTPPPPPSTAPTSGPPQINPPTAHSGTNPSTIDSITSGGLTCVVGSPGRVNVGGPVVSSYNPFTTITDWYLDYIWQWNGTKWVGLGWSDVWLYKQRWQGSWTRADNGQAASNMAYNVTPGSYVAVTQFVLDGEMGGYQPQQWARYLSTVGEPFCRTAG